MRKLFWVMAICLLAVPALCQSTSNYQVATIVDVKTHQAVNNGTANTPSYEVSLQVKGTVYLVLYRPPFGIDTVKHDTGRTLLVQVGAKTITYNDVLGQSYEVPIVSQMPATDRKQVR